MRQSSYRARLLGVALTALLLTGVAHAQQAPKVTEMVPPSGATDVDPKLTELRVTFDQDMAGGFSWTGGGETFPRTTGRPRWVDRRTCVLPVSLEPGRSYRLGINSPSHRNFKSASRIPVVPVRWSFSTKGSGPESPAPVVAATLTETTLKHDDGTMEGKRSLGASGHFVQFQCPPGKWYLTEVQIFGSRYGTPRPPTDSFTITLCDDEFKTLQYIKIPYAVFQRGDERWYQVPVPPLELPFMMEQFVSPLPFWVNVAFNPSSTKGVYLGYDNSDAESFSKVGLPDQTPGPTPENGDWMVRLVVTQNPPRQVAPGLGAWLEPARPVRPWQEEGLVEIKNDDGESDGKLSISGVGPAVHFEGVPVDATLTRLRMFASRYGSGFDPETTFADYYLFDDENRILQTGRIPYSFFSYEEKWVDIPLKPLKVPTRFWVLINPQAHRYKGLYTHYDTDVTTTHSKSGRIPDEMRDLGKKFDWMIRAYVQAAGDGG